MQSGFKQLVVSSERRLPRRQGDRLFTHPVGPLSGLSLGLILTMAAPSLAFSPLVRSPQSLNPSPAPVASPQPLLLSQASDGLLFLGDEGPEVETIQRQLANRGYYRGAIDGIFGPGTEQAVISFQRDNRLTADGVVGPATRAALSASPPPVQQPPTTPPQPTTPVGGANYGIDILQPGSRGLGVAELQQRLQRLGFYDGPITGEFGDRTTDGVRRFQQSQGLTADGIVGPATYTALNNAQPVTPPVTPPPVTPPPVTPPPTTPSVPPFVTSERYSVADLQRRLSNRGFYFGPIDGVLGTATQGAIEDAQVEYGLTRNDVINSAF